MKRLMITLATAASFAVGAYASDWATGTSFENAKVDDTAVSGSVPLNTTGLTYDQLGASGDYWSTPITDAVKVVYGTSVDGEGRPRKYQYGIGQDYYLNIDTATSEPLERYVLTDGVAKEIDTGLYFDGLVKLTAFDEEVVVDANAKFALFLREEEGVGTNLYVVCGTKASGTLAQTQYKVNGAFSPDTWYRLTIKAISDITSDASGIAGFALFINKTAITCSGVDFTNLALNENANAFAEKNRLFPAAVAGTALSSVGFAGKGGVDDIAFLDECPTDIDGKDFNFVTISWPTDGSVVDVKTNGASIASLVGGQLKMLFTGDDITVAWTGSDGYLNGSATVSEAGQLNIGDELVETAAMFTAGQFAGLKLEDISDAIETANVATAATTLKLFKDYNNQISFTASGITLDIGTNNVTYVDDMYAAIEGAKVINGTTGIVTAGDGCAIYEDGWTINGGIFNGKVGGEGCTINGGKFLVSANDKAELDAYAPAGYEFVEKGEYYELEEIKVTTYTLTCPDLTDKNVTVVAATNGVAALTAAGSVEINEDDTVVVTWTATGNYLFENGTQTFAEDGFVMTEAVTLKVPTTTLAVAKIGTDLYADLGMAFSFASAGQKVDILKDVTVSAADVGNIVADITIDANCNVVTLADAQMTVNNNLTLICSGEKAEKVEKGFKNLAQITIAANKTLDLSALEWGYGLIGDTSVSPTARFSLNNGATYKQGGTDESSWNDAITNIFTAVDTTKEIKLAKEAGIATISVGDPIIPVTSVTLNTYAETLAPGATVTLIATVNPSEATSKTVTWASSNENCATVDGNGVVSVKTDAIAGATATITATADGVVSKGCVITVASADPIPPVSPSADAETVNAAVDAANFADTTVKTLIGGDAVVYGTFKAWANTVAGGEKAVVDSAYAAKSFQLAGVVAAPTLFTAEPTLTITSITPDEDVATSWDFQVKLTNGADGSTVALAEAIKDYVQVSDDLSKAWVAPEAEQVSATVTDGIATVVVAPTTDAAAYFMKVKVGE